jgi:hypothetical protein
MPSKKGAISETINISLIYAVHLTHARRHPQVPRQTTLSDAWRGALHDLALF